MGHYVGQVCAQDRRLLHRCLLQSRMVEFTGIVSKQQRSYLTLYMALAGGLHATVRRMQGYPHGSGCGPAQGEGAG